jgi:hypothetical protein
MLSVVHGRMGELLLTGLLTFGALQGADLMTTRQALARGGVETNPIMRAPMGLQLGLKAGATTGLTLWARRHPKAGKIVVWSLNGAYAAVVIHNARVRD